MNFKKVPNKYRPIPFWSWNDELDITETRRQVKLMHKAGIGGFFMHARGGLQTEYMGEEWMSNIKAASDFAGILGMRPFAYDENGWPSGFGNDMVSSKGVEYQLKYLRVEDEPGHNETSIALVDGKHFYYEVNPFYVDNLDSKVVKCFIDKIYEPYYDRFKNKIEGFFTDEPQLSRNGIPWSFILPDEFKREYGEDLIPLLPELFYDVGDYKMTRVMFWKLVTKLFCNNFFKQIYEWCDERGLKFTGHMLSEEFMPEYVTSSGAVMPMYRYFHIPGMDWLKRLTSEKRCLTPYQVASVAEQFGKEQVISETFALCGHNVSLNELKGIYEWQMVRGINLLCPHLEGYTIRGLRKRDYPPAMYYQQPWWEQMNLFTDTLSREGMILSSGKTPVDTLIVSTLSSVWANFNGSDNEKINKINDELLDCIETAERNHLLFHLGDEIIMEENGRVENGKLIIGSCSYSTVVLPDCEILLPTTVKMLDEFQKSGGRLIAPSAMKQNDIIDNPDITYTMRANNKYNVHFFVNSTETEQTAVINKGNLVVNPETGELSPFSGRKTFRPYESLMLIENGKERRFVSEENKNEMDLSGEWNIDSLSDNALVLDKCDYYFDGELVEKNGYILNAMTRACNLLKPVEIKLEYRFNVKTVPNRVYLGIETPEIFDIRLNSNKVKLNDEGYFRDVSIRKFPINGLIKEGENLLEIICDFKQSEEVYENLRKSKIFESVTNKLCFDMELEPIYILGDFGVFCDGEFEDLSNNTPQDEFTIVKGAYKTNGNFYIDKTPSKITLKEIEKQGFLFFSGGMKVSKNIYCENNNCLLKLKPEGISAVNVAVNGCKKTLMFEPFVFEPKKVNFRYNKVELELFTNLRNLLGPFHLKNGDCAAVTPANFYKEDSPWNWKISGEFDDGYLFMERSLL